MTIFPRKIRIGLFFAPRTIDELRRPASPRQTEFALKVTKETLSSLLLSQYG